MAVNCYMYNVICLTIYIMLYAIKNKILELVIASAILKSQGILEE